MEQIIIPAGYALIVGLCYGLAEIFKRATTIPTNRFPIVLPSIGLLLGILWVIFNPVVRIDFSMGFQDIGWKIIESAIYGAACGFVSVGVNQVIKQGQKALNPGGDGEADA